MTKKFKNRDNICYNIGGKVVWESRSVAVTGCIFIKVEDDIFVLVGRRGKNAADFIGKLNLVCGYLDWDESGSEAMEREVWEEAGLDLDILRRGRKNVWYMDEPYRVNTDPVKSNRQNVTLHYGCFIELENKPELSLENNEVEDESSEVFWLNIEDFKNWGADEWAFDHDKIINHFYENRVK